MDDYTIEDTIYRILSGFYFIEVGSILYKVLSPSLSIKRQAGFIYKLALENNKFELSWLSEIQKNRYLEHFDIWNSSKNQLYDSLEDDLKKSKIQLYLQFNNSELKKQIKNHIIDVNKNLTQLLNDKHSFDYLTLSNYAISLKNQFLISKIVYYEDKLLFDNDFEKININLLQKILIEIHKNSINTEILKVVARHDIWRGLWNAGKDKLFSNPTIELTDEQISLINISRTLDSIREHPECPSEEIINDFDALDGWLYYQQEKIDKEKKKQAISDKYGLDKKNGSEVFLVTNSREEAKEIYSLNSPQVNRDLKEMSKYVEAKGTVDWTEIPFVQREIKQQMKQQRQR